MIINANSIIQHVNQIKTETIKHIKVNVIDYSCNPRKCICDNSKYLKSWYFNDTDTSMIADTSLITCNEIISTMAIVSTKMPNTIATNRTKSCPSKKVRYKFDCYILH